MAVIDQIDRILASVGYHHGVPIPCAIDSSRPLVLAKGAPYSDINGHGPAFPYWPEGKPDGVLAGDPAQYAVNSWSTRARSIVVYRDELGVFYTRRSDDRIRLKLLLNSMVVRAGSTTVNAELKAMTCLKGKLSEGQWDSYVLSGAFPETSKRSGVTYVFRKGLPTIALRSTPLPDNQGEVQHFLAALCLHSLAYYESTHVGSYPPTDDVITHLLMVRADERRFWAKAAHHSLNDPRSGI